MPYLHEDNAARQEALYRFLLERGDQWTSMEQTTDSIKLYPAYFRTNYHNSAARRLLTHDIEQINASERFEKIIVSGSHGIKIANESEFSRFLTAELKEVFKKLWRVRKLAGKAGHDQQIDLEGQIREAFLKGD